MTAGLLNIDSSVLLWIQSGLRTGWLNPFVTALTHLGDKGAFWILTAVALMCFRKTRRLGVTCALAMLIGTVVTDVCVKNWVARVRPYELVEGLESLVGAQRGWSFPSGHATCGHACAWVLFCRAPKKYGAPALALAVLIALSRLYVGVHYPSDVLGGALIGICSAAMAMFIADRAAARLAKR